MNNIPTWIAPVLSIIVSFFLPWLIAFVAKSSKRWLNMLIAFGSSAVIGVLSAWVAGNFSSDVWASIVAAITAAQLSYNVYWKPKQLTATETPV